jgi:hypothetical protein
VGHDGKDITPTELVDRYLNNPEICFKEPNKENPQEQEPIEGDNDTENTNISKNSVLPPPVCEDIPRQFSKKNIEESTSDRPLKPLEQWTSTDFVLNACIYCNNNGGYKGPPITTPDEYDRHIISKHKGKPGYPGPADIQLYGLTLNGNGHNGSKVADATADNMTGNGILGQGPKKEEPEK